MKSIWGMAAVTGAALLLAGGFALAQGPGQGPGPGGMRPGMGQGMGQGGGAGMMRMMDTNGDGAVSREEFTEAPRGGPGSMMDVAKEHRAARFQQMDRNGDGKLTPDEMPAMAGSSGQSQ